MERKSLAYSILLCGLGFGCSDNHNSVPQPPSNIAFDIESDTAVVATVEQPSVVSSKDAKYHYKIRVKSVVPPPVVTNSTAMGEAPIKPVLAPPAKKWEDVYTVQLPKSDLRIDVSKNPDQKSAWMKVVGACDITEEASCWDVSGRLDSNLTDRIRKILTDPNNARVKAKKLNRVLVFKKESFVTTWSNSIQEIGLDFNDHETIWGDDLHAFAHSIDPHVVTMPFLITASKQTGQKSEWFEPILGRENKVGKYKIKRVEAPKSEPAMPWRRMYFEIIPSTNGSGMLEARAEKNGDVQARWMRQEGSRMALDLQGLEEIRFLRLVFEERQSIVWMNIPLRPKL